MARAFVPRVRVVAAGCVAVVTASIAVAVVQPQRADSAPTSTSSSAAAVTVRPDVVSARMAAKASGERVEVSSMETGTSTTWVNPDGSFTSDDSGAVVRVAGKAGWTPVDYTLVHGSAGWVPAASPVPVTFADGGGKTAATIGDGAIKTAMSWLTTLPTPTVNGASASYTLDANTTLVLTATSDGFEQSLVLAHAPTSAPTVTLPLTSGLAVASDGVGGFVFTNAKGAAVYTMAAPVMYGATRDPVSQEPTQQKVVTATATKTSTGSTIDLSPSMTWLNDPGTVYPVTIDPAIASVAHLGDTFVADNLTTSQVSAPYLHAGMFGNHASRAYPNFDTSALAGKHVTSAALKLYNNGSNTCTAATMNVYPLAAGADTATVWSTRPAANGAAAYKASASFANGVEPTCANAPVSIDVTNMVNAWAAGTIPNYGMQLSGTETSGAQGWSLCSMNLDTTGTSTCNSTSRVPTLSVTYNSIPGAGTGKANAPCTSVCTGEAMLASATPQLSALAPDADGGAMRMDFEVWAGTATAPTTRVTYGSVNGTAGQKTTWTVPASKLTNGSSYEWRARGYDGTDYGPWSAGYAHFTVDTTAPATPAISSSSTWTAGQWSSPTTGTLTWSDTSSDVATYQYKLDAATWSAATTSTSKSFTVTDNALHTLSVKATDKAGNISATKTYSFGVGTGGVTSPADQDTTQARVTLSAAGPAGETYVAYQWRNGTQGGWSPVLVADVTTPGTSTHPAAWPVPIGNKYTWDLKSTVANGADGLYMTRACLYTSTTDTSPTCESTGVAVTLAAHAFGDSAATDQVGPGTVSKLTGDYDVSSTDVNVASYNGSLSINRDFTTLAPVGERTDASGVFGPGWTTALTGPDAGAGDLRVTDKASSGYLLFTGSDGSVLTYKATTAVGTYPVTFTGIADAADDSVIKKVDASTITMTDTDNTTTTWKNSAAGWAVSSVAESGSDNTTTYTYNSTGLVTRILAPVPAGVTCTSPDTTTGCRSLTFGYTTVTVGSATYTRLQKVTLHAYNPATSAMAATDVASYDYDTNGRLAHAWDPRVSPALKTGYTYDSNGRLATTTAPGLAAWTLSYDSTGRLATASRPDPANGTATTRVVYGVDFTGSNAPVELGATATATWGQTDDLPATATAIFPASHPASAAPSTSDWPYADLTYIDAGGREVNTASYGAGQWLIDTTQYDATGNDIWSLTAGNRAQALTPTGDTDPAVAAQNTSADRADLLATANTYNAAGTLLLSTVGPAHPVQLTDGTTVDARSHSTTSYDQGAPSTGGPFDLPTTEISSALTLDGTDVEAQVTKTGYDPINSGDTSGWTLRQATSSTVQMGSTASSADLVTVTRYDTQGRVIESRLPAGASGGDARSTLTTYYTATGTGTCVSAAQVGLPCTTSPAAQPTTGAALPVITTTYDMYYNVKTVTAVYGSSATRTDSTTYDAAERPLTSSTVVSPASAGGTAVPAVTTGYDSSTGLPVTASTSAATLTTGYDALGRVTSYTDANGTVSTTGYDIDGNKINATDGKATTTWTYDSSTEHRGLVTAENVGAGSAPSTFSAAYDPAGTLATQTYPNGLTATTTNDNAGNDTSLTYTKASATWMTFTTTPGSDDKTHNQTGPESSQTYSYDNADRLTTVQDTDSTNGVATCTTRAYAFDKNSNRTGLTAYPAAADGTCATTTTPATTTATFDQADRLTTTGYAYDTLGRTTTVPAGDAQGVGAHASTTGDLTVGYYANDMVASQTQGGVTRTDTLDPAQNRITSFTDGTTTTTEHYNDGSDNPAWTETGSTWSRNIEGISGDLAATQDQAGTVILQLPNLHGDIVATAADDTTATSIATYSEATEYGVPRSAATATTYGWLGAKERSTDTLGGLTLMGVRLYNPLTSRFLQVDPIWGGGANDYSYPTDPVNDSDLGGNCWSWCNKVGRWASHHKAEIAITAVSFAFPEAGAAYRGYRLYRAIRAGRDGVRASRSASWVAGRIWVGRGARWAKNGRRYVSRDGRRQWRPPTNKGRRGWESNFDRTRRGRYHTQHVKHIEPQRWRRWL